MIATAQDTLEVLDIPALREELVTLQARLDALADHGTNPYEIARLQRILNDARDELAELEAGETAPAVRC